MSDAEGGGGGGVESRRPVVGCCPACLHSDVYTRQRNADGEPVPPEDRYRCRGCGHTFRKPTRRPGHFGNLPTHVRAAILASNPPEHGGEG